MILEINFTNRSLDDVEDCILDLTSSGGEVIYRSFTEATGILETKVEVQNEEDFMHQFIITLTYLDSDY